MTSSRLVDLIAVAAVAVVVLLPTGSLVAKPALVGDKIELDRVAALEDARFADRTVSTKRWRSPTLIYVPIIPSGRWRRRRSSWARAIIAFISLRATAFAEELHAPEAVAEAARAIAACDREGAECDSAARVRIDVVAAPMQALVDSGIDPRKDPKGARAAVAGVLHATHAQGLVKDKARQDAKSTAPKK